MWINHQNTHCVKSVHIRSYSGPYFPAFGLNMERYGVSLRILSEWRKNMGQNNSEYRNFLHNDSCSWTLAKRVLDVTSNIRVFPKSDCSEQKKSGTKFRKAIAVEKPLAVISSRLSTGVKWLATCARKLKVPGSSPAASYVQRWALCSNLPANILVSVKRVKVVDRSYRDSLLWIVNVCERKLR